MRNIEEVLTIFHDEEQLRENNVMIKYHFINSRRGCSSLVPVLLNEEGLIDHEGRS